MVELSYAPFGYYVEAAMRQIRRSIAKLLKDKFRFWISVNDPSAGSPTETLLRLLLPLSGLVYLISSTNHEDPRRPKGSPDHSSVGATGGVYKGQGLNQRRLMTCAY